MGPEVIDSHYHGSAATVESARFFRVLNSGSTKSRVISLDGHRRLALRIEKWQRHHCRRRLHALRFYG
jgi:hypothetical protein